MDETPVKPNRYCNRGINGWNSNTRMPWPEDYFKVQITSSSTLSGGASKITGKRTQDESIGE